MFKDPPFAAAMPAMLSSLLLLISFVISCTQKICLDSVKYTVQTMESEEHKADAEGICASSQAQNPKSCCLKTLN
jgi:hypothetical protein